MRRVFVLAAVALLMTPVLSAQRTVKPTLHGRHWMAITGKPLAATAGATMFHKGGNAVDAACAMLGAVATMWDSLAWGGETQALIYNPKTKKVIGINALGVAPSGATPEFFRQKEMAFPPEYGPLAAVTPGTPGGLLVMLAEYGTMSLKDVLAPSIEMADGYPIEAGAANSIEAQKAEIKKWPYSKAVFLPHAGESREAPHAGEIFKQTDLAATLRKLVDAEQQALKAGKSRKDAIYAAHDRFYKGDIAKEFARGSQEMGGLGAASGVEHPRDPRREGDGLQQLALRAHGVSGDEPGVRRSRFLLRRYLFPAGRTSQGSVVEGVCENARGVDERRRK
jgi:gamma-glutamyltranspeptidase / glutathione hydrolase